MLVHESDILESECTLLRAEADTLTREAGKRWSVGDGKGKEEGIGRGEGSEDGKSGQEDEEGLEVEEVECSGLLEKLRAHDGRRKLVQELRELEEVRREVEEWVGRVLERRFAANGAERRGDALVVGVV